MITAKNMREIADKAIQEKEDSILMRNKNIIEYIEKNIQDKALEGKKFLRIDLDRSSNNYFFPNNEIIPEKEFLVILEKLKQQGFSIEFSYRKTELFIIEWK